MKKIWYSIYAKQSLLYKILVFCMAVFFIVQIFPKKAKFKYEFQKGKPWQHETLYAPFEFPLKKSDAQIETEKQEIKEKSTVYYTKDSTVVYRVLSNFDAKKQHFFSDAIPERQRELLFSEGGKWLGDAYQTGVIFSTDDIRQKKIILIGKHNNINEIPVSKLVVLKHLQQWTDSLVKQRQWEEYRDNFGDLFFEIMLPNVQVESKFTQKALDENLSEMVYTRGFAKQGQIIIAKGEMVEGDKLTMLESLQAEYESQTWNKDNFGWSIFGYYLLVGVCLFIVMSYLKRYRPSTFNDDTKVTVILFNIVITIYLVAIIAKAFPNYIYVVPVCAVMMILKSFFDLRAAIFIFMITILLSGFVIPNSFQFVVMQILAGTVIVLNPRDLHYRLNHFVSAAYITLSYFITYIAFHTITEGNITEIDISILFLFLLNGIGVLFSQPLTYIYEKIFGLVSDVSLLELTDTNSKLLRELSEKAPGTFHHSLQVANLAEEAALEVGANALLVRVGALYHDIGKLKNPIYFTENQKTSVNPHDELNPKQSAKIIIEHVINGIEIARKYKLPDRIIDFIRTHHGTSLVYFFYKKELDGVGACQECDFRYPGPIPFSKETAILMMADSVEAASKSLKNPTYPIIDDFVEKIVKKQFDDRQFVNADITLKEIEIVKKVMKNKLSSIYHLRVEYPD
ncbi:MAG: HDIG domain-containing protein [Capnocytophaga sp.]|nr:HDIG domain-containing protein [Capnocytophaga sp.]